jgi:sugar lactone lactonase YvrE
VSRRCITDRALRSRPRSAAPPQLRAAAPPRLRSVPSICAALAAAVALALLLAACGSDPPADPVITIAPATASVQADIGRQAFVATVQNASNPGVVWRVNGVVGGSAAAGFISPQGVYSAPAAVPAKNPVTVTAVSMDNPAVTASAAVTITPPVSVAVTPATITVALKNEAQFTAVVSNAVNTGVTWAVNGVTGGAAATGTISAAGLYTAPAVFPGLAQITITATSLADPKQSAGATVNLANTVAVSVSPAQVNLQLGASQTFTATVTGTTNTAVVWSVDGLQGGDGAVGVISAQGVYTAPNAMPASPTVTITAGSVADPAVTGAATVTLSVAPNTFSLSPATATLTLGKAQSAALAYQITTGAGFNGTVQLTALGLPPNVTAQFAPPSVTGAAAVQLTLATASISLAASDVPITIQATSSTAAGGAITQTATVLLTITGWSGQVSTVAGGPGGIGFEDGGGTDDELTPYAITSDGGDNLYFTDGEGYAIRDFNLPAAAVTTLAGNPYFVAFPDGEGLAVDTRTQTFYVADARLSQILAYTNGAAGPRVLAGSGVTGWADGAGAAAQFAQPHGLALSPDRSTLYIADTDNDVIRAVDIATGQVTTLAGQPGVAKRADGVGAAAAFCRPVGLAVDPAGANLYITDSCSYTIRRLNLATAAVTTVAGSGVAGDSDGPALAAQFRALAGIAVDPHSGPPLLYVCDNNRIRAVLLGSTAIVYTLAGQIAAGEHNGNGAQASFYAPRSLTVIPDLVGNNTSSLFIADSGNGLLRRLDFANPLTADSPASANTLVTTLAGQPSHRGYVNGGPVGGAPPVAEFDGPSGVVTDGATAYLADTNNNAIRAVSLATGDVTTVAGPGHGDADGPAALARFNGPTGLALAPNGILYIADTGNSEIRRLDLNTQTVTTVAGAPQAGFNDGSLAAARFDDPMGLALSPDGNTLYVADTGNDAIRAINFSAGTVTTLAGGAVGASDGVGAAAQFDLPTGLALSADGTILYISDYANHTIRQLVLATGAVTTIAGMPGVCGHADGFGAAARLCNPALLAGDGRTLFWGDSTAGLVRALDLATGQVYTLAGAPGVLHMADGQYAEVPGALTGPVRYNVTFGVAVAPDDSFLLFADSTANVLRIVK